MADGYLNFDTKIDTSGFYAGTKKLSSGLGGIKSALGKLAAAAAAAFSVAALVNFGKKAVELASDLQEVQNVVDTAFGSMAYKMEQFADTAVETYGISKLTAKQTGSTLMAMAAGMGIAQDSASDMAVALTGLSADMASFYNVEQEVASTALKSVFTGETETLKQFGIVMTQTNLEAYALSQGITKSYQAMTEAEKVQIRYGYVMQATALAQGDFAKTSGGWANQTRMLSEKWKEFSATVGQFIMNVLTPAVAQLNAIMNSLIAYASTAYKSIAGMLGWETDVTSQVTSTASAISDSVDNQEALTGAVKDTKKQLAGFDELNVLSASGGSGSDASSAASPASAIVTNDDTAEQAQAMQSKLQPIIDTLHKLKSVLKEIWSVFSTAISKWVSKINFDKIKESFKKVFGQLAQIAGAALAGVKKVILPFVNLIGTWLGGVAMAISMAIETVLGGISQFLDKHLGEIISWIDEVSAKLAEGFDNLTISFDGIFNDLYVSFGEARKVLEQGVADMLFGLYTQFSTLGTIISDAWQMATAKIAEWVTTNTTSIQEAFTGTLTFIGESASSIGGYIESIFSTLSSWWESDGKPVFDDICSMISDVCDWALALYNDFVLPIVTKIKDELDKLWNDHLSGLWANILSFLSSVGGFIKMFWDKYLKKLVDWLVAVVVPNIRDVLKTIISIIGTLVGHVIDMVSVVIKVVGGIIDFLTGVFTGDWSKAWDGIEQIFSAAWDIIKGTFTTVANLVIDGINLLIDGIYGGLRGLVNGVGGAISKVAEVFGKDINLSIPDAPPQIPKLATGTVIPANYGEFAAILGDNKREAEVVSPLSTIRQAVTEAMSASGPAISAEELQILKRMLDWMLSFDPHITVREVGQASGTYAHNKAVRV